LLIFPFFSSLCMGLSLHNALAVLEGYWGKKTPFVRTPKFSITSEKNADKWIRNSYRLQKTHPLTWLEGLLCVYFAFGFYIGIQLGNYDLLVLHGLMCFGFGAIFYYSLKHSSSA